MRFSIQAVSLCLGVAIAAPSAIAPFSTFSQNTIFVPDANYTDPRVLYARTVELDDGVLLATWVYNYFLFLNGIGLILSQENYSPEPPKVYFPIYRSADGGASWKEISRVQDTVNNFGLRYQPELYRLPYDIGRFRAGTILCAGNSIPTDLSVTKIDVYASEDNGHSWKFVSHVATGGAAIPNNGVPAIVCGSSFLLFVE